MSGATTVQSLTIVVVSVVALMSPGGPALAGASTLSGQGAPPPRAYGGMADDPASGGVVLFGGTDDREFGDTWTWDGSAWTKQHPADAPPSRDVFGFAGDAANGTVVLFGGASTAHGGDFHDTWTWNGSDWTKQAPAHRPPARHGTTMAYDSAHRDVVLFGGCCTSTGEFRRDTWTWDGSDWTERHPAHRPTARSWAAMADDQTHGQVVLFGGRIEGRDTRSTWTWDGTDWTKHASARSPSRRFNSRMAFDPATGQVVLFGGFNDNSFELGDTWTWDGADWTERHPAHAPTRRDGHGLADDAGRGHVVLFGGESIGFAGDTWTWDGADWTQVPDGSIQLSARSGPPGGNIVVFGAGFAAGELVSLKFIDSVHGSEFLKKVGTDASGGFEVNLKIPNDAAPGSQRVKATGVDSGSVAKQGFTVT